MPEQQRHLTSAQSVKEEEGLLFGCILDQAGGGELCDWATAEEWAEGDDPIWLHLANDSQRAEKWLKEKSGVPASVVGAMLAKESRPRSLRVENGLLVILRGVNLNEGASPEDMVAIRMWVEPHRVITLRYERLVTPRDVLEQILTDRAGPKNSSQLFENLAERLSLKANDVIIDIEDQLAALEVRIEIDPPTKLRTALAETRQDTVALRRYLSPQREALANVQYDAPVWLDEADRMGLRETADRTMRQLEDLDAARDRAVVVLDELANKMAESMNRTMYAIGIVTAIFLPLSFLTGLLGINVGGMPGVDSHAAFWAVCIIMGLLMVVEVVLLKRLRWI